MRSFTKVFLIIFVPILLALLLTFYFSQQMIMNDARQELVHEMDNVWFLLERQCADIDHLDASNYAAMVAITRRTSLRVTLIGADGRVVLDSLVPYGRIGAMENHKGRPEVKQALYSDDGVAFRFSTTKNMHMLYFARKLADGRILRLSYPATYVEALQRNFTRQMVYSFLFLAVVVLSLAIYFARKVSLPIQRMNYIADNLEAGKTNIHFPHFRDPSMSKIAGLIYRIYSNMQQKNVALDREQRKLKHIFTTMNQGVLLLDSDNCVLYVNPWLQHALGIEVVSGSSLYNSSNDVQVINFFNELISKTGESFRLPLKEAVFEVNRKVVEDQILLLLRNVTSQVEYEAYKEQLTGNLSHELKTPLAMIMGYAETLRDNPAIDEQTRNKFVGSIYNSSLRLNNIINDVLELHKLEAARVDFAVAEEVALSAIAAEVRAYYGVDGADGVNWLRIDSDGAMATLHQEHLLSVLTNLIDNARKYSTGVEVMVEMHREGQNVVITVDDQGPQIPPAQRERIFERFYTCSRSRNKQHSGSGLGLSIVKHIASLYDGSVTLEANNYGGNRFVVRLTA